MNTNIGHFQCICALKQNTVHRANVLTTLLSVHATYSIQ